MEKILSQVTRIAETFPRKSIFTRFIPPAHPEQAHGAWQLYYRRWSEMMLEKLPECMVDIIPALREAAPMVGVFDKSTYSPWIDGRLHRQLQEEHVTTLVVTAGETDVCILATVLGAVDLGYQVVILSDGVCSGADETQDAAVKLLGDRFSIQLQIITTSTFLKQAAEEDSVSTAYANEVPLWRSWAIR